MKTKQKILSLIVLTALSLSVTGTFNTASAQSGGFGLRGQMQANRPTGQQTGAFLAQIQQRMEARKEQRKQEFINDLALSVAQRQQFDQLGAQREQMRDAHKQARSALRAKAASALEANGDLNAIYQENNQLQDAQTAQKRQLQQSYLAFYETLTPTQQAKVREHLLEMIDHMEERRARMGG
jgi:Spy/CpxP family protein refolding chaperone